MVGSPNWTREQLQAITARGGSLLVSAGAGSGKTAVLTERAIQLIFDPLDPVDADRLLIVTYTKAAAEEMRERIGAKIRALQVEQPENPALQRQLILLQKAHISTVHAFCQSLIRENFERLGVSADFRIADEKELDIWRAEAAAAVIEEAYADGNADFFELVELISTARDDRALVETVLQFYDFVRAHPFYTDWMEEKRAYYHNVTTVQESPWGQILLEEACERLHHAAGRIAAVQHLFAYDQKLADAYGEAIHWYAQHLETLLGLAQAGDWDGLLARLQGAKAPAFKALRGYEYEERKDFAAACRDEAKAALDYLRERVFTCANAEFLQDIADLSPKIDRLFWLVQQFDTAFTALKEERRALDFSDLEHLALQLLVARGEDGSYHPTAYAAELSQRFAQIFVDEYQDTNAVQDMIFTSVSQQGENLFLVGDIKQSIYRFRQARPEIFLAKKADFAPYDGVHFPARIDLAANFRSRPEVTEGINYLFEQLMSARVGDIDYCGGEQLIAGARYAPVPDAGCEVHLVDLSEADPEHTATRREAAYIADYIHGLLAAGTRVQGRDGLLRPLRAGDICILLRAPKSKARVYMDALAARQIHAAAQVQGSFLGSREISAVLALLRVVDNPLLDIDLAAALMSPLFGFTPDEMTQIRLVDRQLPLYSCLVRRAGQDAHCARFVQVLSELRFVASTASVQELLTALYDQTAFEATVQAMEGGDKRLQNLRLLLQHARDYEGRGYTGLTAFLRLVDRLLETGGDLAESAVTTERGDTVAVMSIHRSKGLEFPVVIVADCAKEFNTTDLRGRTLLHTELGFACMCRNQRTRLEYTTVPLEALRCQVRRENLSEEMRMLYVAATRARERLVFVGASDKPAKALAALAAPQEDGLLPPAAVARGKCYLDWILQALLVHPDGGELRAISGAQVGELSPAKGRFTVRVAARAPMPEADRAEPLFTAAPDEEALRLLTARMEYAYPHRAATEIPAKFAISHIAAELGTGEKYRFRSRPAFLHRQGLTPAERGNALHKFMQFCDYARARENPQAEIDRLVREQFLSAAEGAVVAPAQIAGFFASPLAARIFAADRVYREYRFLAVVGQEELAPYTDAAFGQYKTTVQGVADCIFIEDGAGVVVDYKTDRAQHPEELVERYRTQLSLYGSLLGEALGIPIRQCLLYSFALGQQIEIPL